MFSHAFGSAQLLSNGDYMFLAGKVIASISPLKELEFSNQYSTSGTLTYQQGADYNAYRAFRLGNRRRPTAPVLTFSRRLS